MKTQIKLYRNNWITGNSVYAIGWASKGNTCYSGKEFHQLISSLTVKKTFNIENACQLAKELNGSFALIIEWKDKVYLIADRTRSYPILYTTINGVTYITDDLLSMFRDYGFRPATDIRQAEVFLLSVLLSKIIPYSKILTEYKPRKSYNCPTRSRKPNANAILSTN